MFKKVAKLLSVNADAKTSKGTKKGVLTGILYLAPHDLSGHQVCPKATEGCKAACLFYAGRGAYTKTQMGRINKTRWFFEDRVSFMKQLVKDVEKLLRKAERENMVPALRLNGTSDLPWEKIKCVRDGVTYGSIFEAFPEVQAYDYTKIMGRHKAVSLPNYSLTFSLAENNDSDAVKALNQGYNVAVVMRVKQNEPKPSTWGGYPVIDGDVDDLRFKDSQDANIVALSPKGSKAQHDDSGFIRDISGGFVP